MLNKLIGTNDNFHIFEQSGCVFILVLGLTILCWYRIHNDGVLHREKEHEDFEEYKTEIEPWVLSQITAMGSKPKC